MAIVVATRAWSAPRDELTSSEADFIVDSSFVDAIFNLGFAGDVNNDGHGDFVIGGTLTDEVNGGGHSTRVHGPLVTDREVEEVAAFLKRQGRPSYIDSVTEDDEDEAMGGMSEGEGSGDELYEQAIAVICQHRKASTSFIQRHLQIGYNRAARIIEKMESDGLVSPANHVGKREVLVHSPDEMGADP